MSLDLNLAWVGLIAIDACVILLMWLAHRGRKKPHALKDYITPNRLNFWFCRK